MVEKLEAMTSSALSYQTGEIDELIPDTVGVAIPPRAGAGVPVRRTAAKEPTYEEQELEEFHPDGDKAEH